MLSNSVSLFLFLSFSLGQLVRFNVAKGVVVNIFDIGVFLIGIIAVFRLTARKQRRFYLLKPAVFFFIFAFLSLATNSMILEPTQLLIAFLYLLRYITLFSVYLLVVSLNTKQKSQIAKTLYLCGSGIVTLGFLQFFFYSNLRNLWYLGWDDHLYRMFSVFFDPNFTGVLFVLFFIFLLSHIFNTKEYVSWTRSRLFHVAIAVFTGVAILLTYSRTAIITLVASIIVFFVTKRMYKTLLFLLCILFLFLFVSSDIKIEGLNPFRTVSTKARVESMQIATSIIEKNIFFGVGFNAYRFAQHRYGYRVSGEWETSHADAGTDNSFLFVFATSGIFGLFSYIFLLYAMLKLPVQKEHKPLLYASMTGLCASALFLNTLFYPFILLWTWTLFALMENT